MIHWLVELQIGGRIYRYAQEALDVVDASGATRSYLPGLGTLDLSAGAAMAGGEASVSLEIVTQEDWSLMASRGIPLDGGQAVIRRWAEGTRLERARVMLRGTIQAPTYGAVGEPLTVTVQRAPRAQSAVLPHPRQVVDLETWLEPADPAIGLSYPIVIGAPGHTESTTPTPCVPVPQAKWQDPRQTNTETFTGLAVMAWACPLIDLDYVPLSARVYRTPAAGSEYELLRVVDWKIIFRGSTSAVDDASSAQLMIHSRVGCASADTLRIVYWYTVPSTYTGTRSTVAWLGGHASQVRMEIRPSPGSDFGGDLLSDQSVTDTTDLLSQPVQVVNRPFPLAGGSESGIGSPDDAIYLGFRDDTTYGGGLRYRGDRLLRGAGDVIEYMLQRYYSGQVDAARVAGVQPWLNRWKIDAWIEEPVNAWEWLQSEVFPLLPIEIRESPEGIYPAVIRYDVTTMDARGEVIAGANADRDSAISLTSDEVVNEVIIRYRPVRDTWQGVRTLTAQSEQVSVGAPNQQLGEAWSTESPGWYGAPDERVIGSQRAALSQARYGLRTKEIKAAALWDTASAILTATWILDRYAMPRRRVRYVVSEDRYDVGDVVRLTDDEVHIADVPAIVTDTTPQPGGTVALDLVLVED